MAVVSWVPVPKAMPESNSMIRSPGAAFQFSQLGLITRCWPARKGL